MPMNKSKPEMEMPKPQQYVEERMPGGKYYDDGEAWREMPLPMDSSSQLSDDAFFRYGDGLAEHGGRFLGQPTAHLREELIDALRYAEMAEKQIAWLTTENERLEAILAHFKAEHICLECEDGARFGDPSPRMKSPCHACDLPAAECDH